MNIPRTIDELTPQWLTQALRAGGVIEDKNVTHIEANCVTDDDGRQKGNLSTGCQLKVQYDTDDASLPQSLFVKLSRPIEPQNWLNVYRTEVNFYQNFAQESGVRTLQCYFSDIDLDTGLHVLLLEDMSDARCGSVMQGYTVQEAEQAIVAIARFHAMWWGSPRLNDFAWDGEPNAVYYAKDFQADWETVTAKIQCPVPDALQEISGHLGAYIEIMYNRHGNNPQTLIHFDFHIENLMFPSDGSPMTIIDWQSLECGRGVYDVVYNMITSLTANDRRQHEIRLLRLYHETLLENGVTDYSFDDCYEDYVIGFFRCVHIFILIFLFDLFDSESERMRFRDVALPRFETFILDHPIHSILNKYRGLLAIV